MWLDNQVRVTVQLSEAESGRQLWSERYDRSPSDVLNVHDEIALRVASALQIKLTEGEQARVRSSGTRNLEAWRLATQGYEAFLHYDPPSNAESRRLLEEAVRVDPNYPWAWSALGAARLIAARFGFVENRAEMLASADNALARALSLDPNLPNALGTLGSLHLIRSEYEKAESAGRRAIELAPSNSEMHAVLAQTLLLRGKFAEAVEQSQLAVRLSPRHPSWYLIWQAWGNVFLGKPLLGLEAGQRMLAIAESPMQKAIAEDSIAFALVEAGRISEAHAAVAEGRASSPDHGLTFHRRTLNFEHPEHFKRFVARLEEAGLPE
jgi:tetratricopeptide (TPR) repeat protein